MSRQIYEVYAKIVDANGTCNTLSGYPKTFDSKNYNDNEDKALMRAKGEFHDVVGAMCKRDDRKLQTAFLLDIKGGLIDCFTFGTLEEPEEEPENEPEEPEPESEP